MAGQVPDSGLPVGTNLVYNAVIETSFFGAIKTGIWSPETLFEKLGPALANWGLQLTHSDYSFVSAALSGNVPITLNLQMVGPNTYAQPNDVRSIVDGEIFNVLGGSYVTGSNISSWQIPQAAGGSGQVVDTGAPANNTSVFGDTLANLGLSGIGSSISDGIKSATSNLGLGSGIVIIVLGTIAVVGVVILISPTAPAQAVAGFAGSRRRR